MIRNTPTMTKTDELKLQEAGRILKQKLEEALLEKIGQDHFAIHAQQNDKYIIVSIQHALDRNVTVNLAHLQIVFNPYPFREKQPDSPIAVILKNGAALRDRRFRSDNDCATIEERIKQVGRWLEIGKELLEEKFQKAQRELWWAERDAELAHRMNAYARNKQMRVRVCDVSTNRCHHLNDSLFTSVKFLVRNRDWEELDGGTGNLILFNPDVQSVAVYYEVSLKDRARWFNNRRYEISSFSNMEQLTAIFELLRHFAEQIETPDNTLSVA